MSKIKIDGKEYDTDSLSKESKDIVQSLKFVRIEIERLNAQLAIFKTAESSYTRGLMSSIEKSN